MGYSVMTDVYEGPFELLLGLISRQQVDIYQVRVSTIVDQYLREVRTLKQLDLNVATEFLVVAATLLELKAFGLLPESRPVDEVESEPLELRDLRLARLLQYRAFKAAAAVFGERMAGEARFFPRSVALDEAFGACVPDLVSRISSDDLGYIAAALLRPRRHLVSDGVFIAPIKVSVRETMVHIGRRLAACGSAGFRELTAQCEALVEVVAHFLALLELYRRGLVDLEQGELFGEISARWVGNLEVLEGELAGLGGGPA
ncbi:MAG: segregation/condensation protein A [Actinomycetota bacterium]